MRKPTIAAAAQALALLLAACETVAEQRDRSVDEVRRDVSGRIGFDVAVPDDRVDDGAVAPAARELLVGVLNEDVAVRVALLNNRTVRASFEELGIAAAALSQASRISNPVFSANAKGFDAGSEIELEVSQPFLDLLFLPLRKQVAQAELDVVRARVASRIVALAFDVRRAFVEVRAAQARVELYRQMRDSEQAALDLHRELHAAGNLTDPVLTAQEMATSRAKLDLAAAEAAAAEAREPLNVLLGLWGEDTAWRIEGGLEEPSDELDLEEVEARSIAASLALAEGRAEIELWARRAGIAPWEITFPAAGVGVVAKREASNGDWGIGPAATIGLPLFDLGAAQRASIGSELRRALAEQVATAVHVRARARQLRDRNATLAERVRYLREVDLGLHARLVTETLRNFNAMQIGVFEVFSAKERELAARDEYLDALREAALARLDLRELLSGHVDPEGLDERATQSAARRTGQQDTESHR